MSKPKEEEIGEVRGLEGPTSQVSSGYRIPTTKFLRTKIMDILYGPRSNSWLVALNLTLADNLKKSGAFIPGIRPGKHTAKYIDGVLTRLTMFGAAYMAEVCLLPQMLVVFANVPFYLGGTSLLIVVVVIMDFMAQVQSHLMSHQYDSVMKKANL